MEINLICFPAVIHTLIKKLLYYKEVFNNTLYSGKKQNNMLSFNLILSQCRALESLKIFQRGFCPLTPPLGGVPPLEQPSALLELAVLTSI